MTCFDAIDLMGVALEGCVPPSARPGFDVHLVECGPCRIYYEQLTVTVRALEHLPRAAAATPDPALRARLLRRFRERNSPPDA